MRYQTEKKLLYSLGMVAVLLLALLIRLWDIQRESLWADEGWTMVLAAGPTPADVVQTMARDQHPPLYFVLVRTWMDAVGNSEFSARLLSTFWSLITIAAVARLAKDWFSGGVALSAALLLALTDNDIMLSREIRHYTQMAALAALSVLFYLRYLRNPNRTSGIGWFLSAVGLLYTHYLGALVIAVQGIHALLCARPMRHLSDVVVRFALIGLAWLPQFLVFLQQSSVRYINPKIFQSTLPNTPETFVLVRTDVIGTHFGLTLGLLLLGLVYIRYRFGQPRLTMRPILPTLMIGLWAFLPFATLFLVNERFPILTTRNFLLVTPAVALLVAHGLFNLDRTARTFALIVLVFVNLTTLDAYHLKPPYRPMAEQIAVWRAPTEPLLMDIWVDDFALRYHVGQIVNADPRDLPLISLPEWRDTYRERFFDALREYLNQDVPAFWLAYWGKNEDGLLDFLPTLGYERSYETYWLHYDNRIWLYRYDRTQSSQQSLTDNNFDNQLRVHGEYYQPTVQRGETLHVNLIWEALALADGVDYSVSVLLLDNDGNVVASQDAATLTPTSSWESGKLYFDSHALAIPADIAPGRYRLGIRVYWYLEPERPLPLKGGTIYYSRLPALVVQ